MTNEKCIKQSDLKIKDHFWNTKRSKHVGFDEEKPSASSTIADEDESVKYRQSSRRSRQNQAKRNKLNKKTLETFSASQ